MLSRSVVAVIALAASSTLASPPEWFCTIIEGPGGVGCVAASVGRGTLSGFLRPLGGSPTSAASIWMAPAPGAVIDLRVQGALDSTVVDTNGTSHVGQYTAVGNLYRAAMWTGSPLTRIELHNPAFPETVAAGVDGEIQVGAGYISRGFPETISRAVMWSGSAASMVHLNPTGALVSAAYAAAGGKQVGFVVDANVQRHAGFWRGSPESWTDLHPDPRYWTSTASSISTDASVIGGSATFESFTTAHACAWIGDPPVFVDLHPVGDDASYCTGTTSTMQVGFTIGATRRVVAWRGSGESMFDLTPYLPPDYREFASGNAIDHHDGVTWVVGSAFSSSRGVLHAVVWRRPDCYADFDGSTGRGTLDIFDYLAFANAYAASDVMACECDDSSGANTCDIFDFLCFQNAFAAGCL